MEAPELSPRTTVADGTEPKGAPAQELQNPNVERQQSDEEQRLLAQRQREREENDDDWQRYLDTLEPEIRAQQEARQAARLQVFSTATPTRGGIDAPSFGTFGTLGEADYLAFGVWAEVSVGEFSLPVEPFFYAAGGPFPLDNLPTTGGRAEYRGAWRALVGDEVQTGFAQFRAFWGNVAAGNPGTRAQLNGFSGLNGEDIVQGNDAFGNSSVGATDGRFIMPLICASLSCYINDDATATGDFYNGGVNTPETEPGHFGGTFDFMVGTTAEDAKRAIGAFGTALQP